jgi:hypothetical protein
MHHPESQSGNGFRKRISLDNRAPAWFVDNRPVEEREPFTGSGGVQNKYSKVRATNVSGC